MRTFRVVAALAAVLSVMAMSPPPPESEAAGDAAITSSGAPIDGTVTTQAPTAPSPATSDVQPVTQPVTTTTDDETGPLAATGPSTPIGALVAVSGLALVARLTIRFLSRRREG
ncbi:hypothetical protein FHS23_001027 [Prauserella isguenensis]|uniref:Uncharacterized protein n=1 Tax=Prauserella isguenensis TaxID=1470180 RepID=A0A839RXZ9_9PSEU|nr:hypothetical protein [Prauserella isguenensis]MBB3050032.1 hypothetical protein [Prauserella isguenensis]